MSGSRREPSVAARIDSVCLQFEADWKETPGLRLEPYLDRVPPSIRPQLFSGLLEIELTLRQGGGETPEMAEYQQRFPDALSAVETVYRRVFVERPPEVPRDAERAPDQWATVEALKQSTWRNRLGDYELLEQVGRGGMGVVYKARQVRLNQTVALKVLPERCLDDSQAVARFQREMQSVGSLDHPNIVRAFNAGEDHGSHFLVMEFVEGITLDELGTRANGTLPVGAACELIRQAALGLQHAYEHGLVHRDIKPANLMLSRTGVVKILDLGLARLRNRNFSHTLTQTGMAMGTPDFMAPEQCHDASTVDIRGDIYSLGCTLYFLLTGRPPYAGPDYDTIGRKLMAHATAPLPSLVAERRDCPEDIDRILAHMMAKEPDERFDTPGELADAIGLFADRHQLMAAVPGTKPVDQATVPSRPGIKSSEIDTDKKPSRHSSPRRLAGPHWRSKRPWYRTASGLGAIVLLAVAFLGGSVWRLVYSGKRPPQDDPSGKNAEVEPDAGSAKSPQPDSVRQRFADEACILPGLNGEWWFDEMPWLVPFVRQAIAEQLLQGTELASAKPTDALAINPALDADTDKAKEWLRSRVEAARQQRRFTAGQEALLQELMGIPATGSDREAVRKILDQAYQHFDQAHAGGEWSAVDLHTCAVLQHSLAQTSESTHTPQAALERYRQAREAYAKLASPQRGLERLCLLDLGWFYSQFVDDYDEMMRCFTDATDDLASPFVEAQVLVSQGRAACSKDNYAAGDLAYAAAIKKTEETYLDEISHPLVASLNERYAWSLIYQWKVAAATERFSEARAIRIRLEKSRDLAVLFRLHAEHGLAMAHRYRGDLESARSQYDDILRQVRRLRETADVAPDSAGSSVLKRKRDERWYNSSERRADCDLYSGAASRSGAEGLDLKRTCELYREAYRSAETIGAAAQLAMSYKLAIALALNAETEEARQELANAEQRFGATNRESDKRRIELLRRVARATVAVAANGDATEGRQQLRKILDDLLSLNPGSSAKDRCEVLELYLFSAELLVASALREPGASPDADDLQYLTGALWRVLGAFRGLQDEAALQTALLPYLRRYFEIGVEAAVPEPAQTAQFVLSSRLEESPTDDSRVLAFFFQDYFVAQPHSIAILQGDEGEWELFELAGLTRVQILEKRPDMPLPDNLIQRVKQLQAAGHAIQVSWCDERCWVDPSKAIGKQYWPPAWTSTLGAEP